MLDAIKAMFASKKFLAMLAGIVASLAAKIGWDVPADDLLKVVTPLVGSYIIGQGAADFGKEKVKAEA